MDAADLEHSMIWNGGSSSSSVAVYIEVTALGFIKLAPFAFLTQVARALGVL